MALMETLYDDFSGSIDTSKWVSFVNGSIVTVTQTGGQVVVTPATSLAGSNYAGYVSLNLFDMTDSHGRIQFAGIPNNGQKAQMYFTVAKDASNKVTWLVEKNRIYCIWNSSTLLSSTYNASDYAYVGFKHDNATNRLYWQRSADGINWVNLTWINPVFVITSMYAEFGAGTYASTPSPGTAVFDNFNTVVINQPVTLSGSSSLTATPIVDALLSVSMAGTASLEATASLQVTQNEIDRKQFLYKIYNSDGDFLGTWSDVVSDFTYSQEINSAGSAVEIELARNSDTLFLSLDRLLSETGDTVTTEDSDQLILSGESNNAIGPGSNVDLNLNVEVIVFYGQTGFLVTQDEDDLITEGGDNLLVDDGAVNGKKLFTGYISRYVSRYGGQENTLVTVLSHGAELDQYLIQAGGFTQIDFNSYDPSNIMKGVLDLYGGIITYNSTSIEPTGTVVSYTFNTNTTLEGVKKSLELAPADWSFFLDMGENIMYMFGRPTQPSHTFVLGKHIVELNLEKSIEELVNVVYFSGGDIGGGVNLFKKYEDATSIATYRQGLQRVSDNRVTLESSAQILSESIIERGKDPRYRSNVSISDKVYDIESIRLGQLVAFRNFGNFVDDVTMQIVRIDYSPDKVSLQLDTLLPSIPKRVEDIKRNLEAVDTVNNPTAPS